MTLYLNGKLNSEFLNPAILDWLTLTAQHGGYLAVPLPAAIKINEADGSTSSTSAFTLARRPYRQDLANALSNLAVTTTSLVEITVLNAQRFFFGEKLFSKLYLNGNSTGQCFIGITSSTTVSSYLNDVVVALKVLQTNGNVRTLGVQTVQVDVSNATTIELFRSIAWNFSVAGGYVDLDEKLFLEISTTGYVASAATCTHRLCFTPGSSELYVEIQV